MLGQIQKLFEGEPQILDRIEAYLKNPKVCGEELFKYLPNDSDYFNYKWLSPEDQKLAVKFNICWSLFVPLSCGAPISNEMDDNFFQILKQGGTVNDYGLHYIFERKENQQKVTIVPEVDRFGRSLCYGIPPEFVAEFTFNR